MTIERCPICGDLLLERHLHAETPNTVYGTAVNPTQVVHEDGTVEVERRSVVEGIVDPAWFCVIPGCSVEPYWSIGEWTAFASNHSCGFHLGEALELLGAEAGEPFTVQRISFTPPQRLEDEHV